MLRDLDTSKFKAVYIVTGYTDLRNGIDEATLISEMASMVSPGSSSISIISILLMRIRFSCSVADEQTGSKDFCGKAMDFCCCTNDSRMAASSGRGMRLKSSICHLSSTSG